MSKGSQRTKGNVKPAKSDAVADLVGTSTAFIGFDSQNSSFNLQPEVHAHLKKLQKKDPNTKIKSLHDLCDLLPDQTEDSVLNLLPRWAAFYPKLCLEDDNLVRKNAQMLHSILVTRSKKAFAPYLKSVIPYWLLSMHDPFNAAAREANNSFNSLFPDEKCAKVMLVAKEEICSVILDNLKLSPSNVVNEEGDKDRIRYNRMISQTLQTAIMISQYFPPDTESEFQRDLLGRILALPGLIKFLESEDLTMLRKRTLLSLLEILAKCPTEILNDATVVLSLKPLENFALNETEENLLAQSWNLIHRLENFQKFTRTPKHSKQFSERLLASCLLNNSHILPHVSGYLLNTEVNVSLREQFLNRLIEVTISSINDQIRFSVLDEMLRSVFLWKTYSAESYKIFVLRLCDLVATDHGETLVRSLLIREVLTLLGDESNEWLKNKIKSNLEKLCEGDLSPLLFIAILIHPFEAPKSVRFDDPSESAAEGAVTSDAFIRLAITYLERMIQVQPKTVNLLSNILDLAIQAREGEYQITCQDLMLLYRSVANAARERRILTGQFVNVIKTRVSPDDPDLPPLLKSLDSSYLEALLEADVASPRICVTAPFQQVVESLFQSTREFPKIAWKILKHSRTIPYEACLGVNAAELERRICESMSTSEFKEVIESESADFGVKMVLIRILVEKSMSEKECLEILIPSVEFMVTSGNCQTSEVVKLLDISKELLVVLNDEDGVELFSKFAKFIPEKNVSNSICGRLLSEIEKRYDGCKLSIQKRLVLEDTIQPRDSCLDISWSDFDDKLIVCYFSMISRSVSILSIARFSNDCEYLPQLRRHIISARDVSLVIWPDLWNESCRNLFGKACPESSEIHPVGFIVDSSSTQRLLHPEDVLLSKAVNGDSDRISSEILKLAFERISSDSPSKSHLVDRFFEIFFKVTDSEELLCSSCDLSIRSAMNVYLNRECVLFIHHSIGDEDCSFSPENWDTVLCAMVCWAKSVDLTPECQHSPLLVSFCVAFSRLYCRVDNFMSASSADESDSALGIVKEFKEVFQPEILPALVKIVIVFVLNAIPEMCNSSRVVSELIPLIYDDVFVEDIKSLSSEYTFIYRATYSILSTIPGSQIISYIALEKFLTKASISGESLEHLLEFPEESGLLTSLSEHFTDSDLGEVSVVEDPESHRTVSAYLLCWGAISIPLGKMTYSEVDGIVEKNPEFLDHFKSVLGLSCKLAPGRSSGLKAEDFLKKSLDRSSRSLADLAFYILVQFFVHLPRLVKNWFDCLDRRSSDAVNSLAVESISSFIISRQIELINSDKKSITDDRLTIKAFPKVNMIQAQYSIEDFNVDVKLSFAPNFPIGRINIEEIKKKKIGVKEEEWQRLLLDLKIALEREAGSVVLAIEGWRKTLDKLLAGVEECCVCMAILHPSNRSLPTKPCKVCKKKFHAICLYTWFEKGTANCPYCRSVF